jgi:DNA-binding response OmpR family regulator
MTLRIIFAAGAHTDKSRLFFARERAHIYWQENMMAETKKKIVCIEDEPTMIGLVKTILDLKGFEVIGALGGREGLETVRRVRPDLVLLDLMMPDVDGEQVYQHLKADDDLRHIPVIILTADAKSMTRVVWEQVAKADGFVAKPFNMQELVQAVRKVLG